MTPRRPRPELRIVLPLEGRVEVQTSAETEGDFARLVAFIESSPDGRRLLEALDDLREAA